MEIVEDLGIGKRVKQAGLAQRVAFGRDLVSIHWASGVHGIVNVMTKNIFAIFRFNPMLLLFSSAWMFMFCIVPFGAVFLRAYSVPAGMVLVSMSILYGLMGSRSGLSAWNVSLAPFAAAVFIFTLVRSMMVTLRQGGVIWRGTFYPLAELRRSAAPLCPRTR